MSQPNLRCAQGPLSLFLARCKWLRNDQGQAQVELAVIFAFLGLPILLGTVQMGILVYDSIEVTNAPTQVPRTGCLPKPMRAVPPQLPPPRAVRLQTSQARN